MPDVVKLSIKGNVAWVVLDRPDALNGIDESVLDGLDDAIAAIHADETVKAVVITGEGDTFCVGLDIGLLGRAFDDHAYFARVLERYKDILLRIEALPVPVIAAVYGLARAGGFELMLACDIVIAAEDARIGDNHLQFGVMPGGGSTQRLPRKVGDQVARDLLFTGRWIDGTEAARIGLALRAVPLAQMDAEVERFVTQLRPLSRGALAATKAAVSAGASLPMEQAVAIELEAFKAFLRDDPNADAGYRAFVAGRDR